LFPGICAGKSSIASYLVDKHEFKRLRLARTASTPAVEKSASNVHVPPPEASPVNAEYTFPDASALLDFVTLRWRERWVTTDIWDESVVDAFLKRPFFLLISVDAPVSVRWQRFKDRYESEQLVDYWASLTDVDALLTTLPLQRWKTLCFGMMHINMHRRRA
jgi:dCMP deaminase